MNRSRKLASIAAGLLALGLLFGGCGKRSSQGDQSSQGSQGNQSNQSGRTDQRKRANTSAATKYTCPMHPTYVSDRPGDCPICGMRLVPVEQDRAGAAEADSNPSAQGGSVPGMSTVRLSDEGIRLAGIRTAPATQERLDRTIRTVGLVLPDESRIRHMHTKVAGWIERLYVNTAGQEVHRGDPVLSIYSPELLAGEEEFLRAIEARRALDREHGENRSVAGKATSGKSAGEGPTAGEAAGGEATVGEAADVKPEAEEPAGELRAGEPSDRLRSADFLVQAARQRLHLFDVPGSFLDELERTGKPSRAVTLQAPSSGVVTSRGVFEGQAIDPGTELYTVTDLSEIWIEGNFYESDATFLQVGESAELTLPYDPSVSLIGTIRFIYPYLDPASRTLKVRFVFANPHGRLKPGMYANVSLSLDLGVGVVVPDNAVLDTGERKIVFVASGQGTFTPREVEVGMRAGGKAQILSGVSEGEEVVVKANFLLDSESRIRAAAGGGE